MAKKVYIGVGHGGKDPGAVANGFKEKELNLSIALACRDELVRHGVNVIISRTKDVDSELSDRIAECNFYSPDYALDIHNNAGGGDGIEVYHTYLLGKGKTLANNIIAEVKKIGQNSRGTKIKKNRSGKDYFGFIRQINCPSVIVECAFVDNKNDIKIIDTVSEQKKMGVAIAKGILKSLGISYKSVTSSSKKTYVAGAKLYLKNCPLYISSSAKTASSKKTGTYYLWSGEVVNKRIRITNAKTRVGKALQVTGWIDVANAK